MRGLRLAAIIFALYSLGDLALNKYALGDGWTILWPVNGITIGLLLMRPRKDWPAIFAGVFLGLGLGEYLDGNTLLVTVAQRSFSAMEVYLSALILPRFESLEPWLKSRWLSARLYCALILGPGLSAIPAALLAHYEQHQSFAIAFNNWATADALGIVATLPFVLCVRTPEMYGLFRLRHLPTTVATLGLCFGVVFLIFSWSSYPVEFLFYPVLLLVDVTLSFAGASIAALGACLLAVYLTIHHPGPFILAYTHSPVERDLMLQIYLSFHLFALFPASIVFLERQWMTVQIRDANAKLTLLAATDALTGIPNRRSFDERFATEWRGAARNRTSLALLMVDIDSFKQFNDEYGHVAGDVCLRTVAEMLVDVARRPRDLAARYGGEEFTILLPETELEAALDLAENLRALVSDSGIDHERSSWKRVTISIGCVAMVPRFGELPQELLELADKALYRAKQLGRNRVQSTSRTE